MKDVFIQRRKSEDWGTPGDLWINDCPFKCVTLELPDRNNAPGKSCIIAATYRAEMAPSTKNPETKEAYMLQGVSGRSAIEIHSGNWAGDVDKGYFSNVLGCILQGEDFQLIQTPYLKMQMGVTMSKHTIKEFEGIMKREPFMLHILAAI